MFEEVETIEHGCTSVGFDSQAIVNILKSMLKGLRVQSLGPTWWKERNNSCKVSSDLCLRPWHTCMDK